MTSVAPITNTNPADTCNWDTVFAAPISAVNSTIISRRMYPLSFDYEDPNGKASLKGTFGPWQICMGGDGENVRFQLPISDVSGWFTFGNEKIQVGVDKAVIGIQIKLTFLDHIVDDTDGGSSSGTPKPPQKKLVARTTSSDTTDPVASSTGEDWTGSNLTTSDSDFDPKDVIPGLICKWCNAHLDQFTHIFAVVDLNDEADKGDWDFLKPRAHGYAYLDRGTVDDSVLAILCMTLTSKDPVPTVAQVTEATIPSGQQSGFLISNRRFLSDLLIPSLCQAWPNATPSSFVVNEDGLGFTLAQGATITLPTNPDDKQPQFPAVLSELTVSIEVDVLKFETYTEKETEKDDFDDGAAITACCRSTHWYQIQLGTNAKGEQTFVYSEAQTPQELHFTKESYSKEMEDLIIDLVAVVGAIVLTVVTDGVALGVGLAVLGLLSGGNALATAITKDVNNDNAPSMDMLIFNATKPITWSDTQNFKVTSAGFNGCFQLGGTLD